MSWKKKIAAAVMIAGVTVAGLSVPSMAQARPADRLTTTISGFHGGSPWMHGNMAAQAAKFAKALPFAHTIVCTGYTSGPIGDPADAWLARYRAINVCRALKKANPNGVLSYTIRSVNTNTMGADARKVVVVANPAIV